jgi:radical SAM-linked protein
MFERAMSRAELPVRHSEGFNPRPRMTIALPRSVGVASSDELLVLELTSPLGASRVVEQMSRVMPEGIRIVSGQDLDDKDRRLPYEARYEMGLSPSDGKHVLQRAAAFLSRSTYEVDRDIPKRNEKKRVDIRSYVTSIDVAVDRLQWTQLVTTFGTVRPDEMLEALGFSPQEHVHRLHRFAVKYHA